MTRTSGPRSNPLSAQLKVRCDHVRRWLLYPTPTAPLAIARFDQLRFDVANKPVGRSGALLLECLILFDGVIDPADLPLAYAAAASTRKWRHRPFIEWQRDDRWVRRYTSVFTTSLINPGSVRESYEEASAQLVASLRDRGGAALLAKDPITDLLADAAAWAAVMLPGYLATHVSGIAPLASVPPRVLAREQSGLALAPEAGAELAIVGLGQIASVLSSVVRHDRPNSIDAFSIEITSRIRLDAGSAKYASRRRSVERLHEFCREQQRLTYPELLLVMFAIHLLTCGTPHSEIIAVDTARDYLSVTTGPLLRALAVYLANPDDLARWISALGDGLESVEVNQRSKASACITAFLAFMADHTDIPRLTGTIARGKFLEPAPRANLLHPAEDGRIVEWLSAIPTRLGRQAYAIYEGLRATGGRAGDLWTLTLENTRVESAQAAHLVVDPLPTNDRKKRVASSREIPLDDERCREALLAWKRRRIEEGAGPRDLLFGDPAQPRLTWCEGETRTLILTCVKGATGDTSVNLHTLRHTHITAALAEVPLTVGGEYLADCISARHGHESARSTRESYDHGHELPLRLPRRARPLPAAVRACSLALAGSFAGRAAQALVAREDTAGSIRLGQLCAQRNRTDVPDVTSDFALAAPDRPEFVSLLDTPARFDAVRGVLIDATAGHPIPSIARRRDIAELLVSDVLLAGARAAGRRLSASQLTGPLEILFAAVWSAASCFPDFGRIGQPKLLPLASYLETAAPLN